MPKLFSTFFYLGCLPRFQASITSFLGFAIFWILFYFQVELLPIILIYLAGLISGIFVVSAYLKTLNNGHDPKEVVLDEFFAAAIIPFFFYDAIYSGVLVLFFYRVLDILKPGFLKKIDSMKGVFSIFLDDFAAVFLAVLMVKSVQMLMVQL